MNELLQKGIGLFPAYFRDLMAIVTGPKGFVSARLDQDRHIDQALTFLAISFAIGFVLSLPLLTQAPLLALGQGAAFTLVQVAGFGAAIWLAWRMVGGRGSLSQTLVISLYYAGIIELMSIVVFGTFLGTMRLSDPELFDLILLTLHNGKIHVLFDDPAAVWASPGIRVVAFIEVPLAALILIAWLIAGWGAYRAQHQVARRRSPLALLLFLLLGLPLMALLFVIASALLQ